MTRRFPRPLSWLAGLLAAYLIAPLVAGLLRMAGGGWGSSDWSSVDMASLAQASLVSVASATLATLLVSLCGIPLGYALARRRGRGMGALGFLVQLPLALPPLASGVLLLFLFGYDTPLGRLTDGALTDSFAGVVLAESFVAAPFLVIAARSAFAGVDPILEDVAATLGRQPLDTFFRVGLPIAWPAILSGMLLAWLRAFGEFGATVMVAYHPYSLPVYSYVAFGGEGLPAMLPILVPTLVLALGFLGLSEFVARRGERRHAARSTDQGAIAPPSATAERPPRPAPAEPVALHLKLDRRLGSFHLDFAWSPRARRLAILGPSGSGKSFTLKLIAGIEPCAPGNVRFGEADLSGLHPAARAVGYVPQNYGLFPHLTVSGQLAFPPDADAGAAAFWVRRLGLAGLEGRRPSALSLGQQQRVALARALVRPVRLLLLDEPFSALDAPLRTRLRQEMLALQRELDVTTVLVTHDPAEAALLADEIIVLDHGRALQSGPTEAVFQRPAGEIVARLLGAENAAEGIALDEGHISLGEGVGIAVAGPPLTPGQPVGWSFSPAAACIATDGPYRGRIESAARTGLASHLVVRLGRASLRIAGTAPAAEDGWLRFGIDPEAIQVWPLVSGGPPDV